MPVADIGEVREAVVFMLGGQRYALPIEAVQEIQQIVAMNEVPETMPGIVGMINLRGEVIPAVDLRRALGMEAREYALQTPMVIARLGSSLVALVVDEVEDVRILPAGSVQAPGEYLDIAERLIGVCRVESELIFLLDPERLLERRAGKRRTRKKAE